MPLDLAVVLFRLYLEMKGVIRLSYSSENLATFRSIDA
jgi:hypothetical protein